MSSGLYANTQAPSRAEESPRAEASPIRLANILLSRWRLMVTLPLALALSVLIVVLIRGRTYSAISSFVPNSSQTTQSRLSGIAAQFGIDIGSGVSDEQSPAFYRTLLLSDEILFRIADGQYSRSSASPAQRLAEILETDEEDERRQLSETTRKLRKLVNVSVEKETGIVWITVQTRWPVLSLQINQQMLALVNEFNQRKRRELAEAEQDFVQKRLDDVRGQLRQTEDDLQRFLQRNRQYQNDPQLVFEFDRLQRAVEMKQSVYTTLAQSYEQASLTALRDTPVITTVEQPKVAATPDPRRLALKVLLGLGAGLFLAIVVALVGDYLAWSKQRFPAEYAQFRTLSSATRQDLRKALSGFRKP